MVCGATAVSKTALDIVQLWFKYFAASCFKALGVYFFRKAKEQYAPVACAFSPIPLFKSVNNHHSLTNLSVPFQHTRRPDKHESATYRNSSIQGFELFRSDFNQLATFSTFSVLSARKTSTAMMVFSSPKCSLPCVCSVAQE